MVKNLPMQEMQETLVRSLGWEDPLEEGMQPTLDSCLEKPIDRGAWQSTVHKITNSQT